MTAAFILTAALASASTPIPKAAITPWKHGAQHADSLFHNRDLAFGFGIIAGSCQAPQWATALRLMAHGHEPLNHSWAHSCPRNETWCQGPGWSGRILAKEVDSAHAAIERNLKHRPLFYLFPFDIWEPAHLDHLKSLGYLGARSGSRRDINQPGFTDFFDLHFDAFHPRANKQFQMFSLDDLVDSALKAGGWAIRETHGVADGSYGALAVDTLRNHLEFVRAHRDAGRLWVAPPTTVLKYRKQAMAWIPAVKPEKTGWSIYWNRPDLDTALFDGEVTVALTGFPGSLAARQGSKPIDLIRQQESLLISVRPHRGPIILSRSSNSPSSPAPPAHKP